jgi:hypothetical protein
MKYCVLVIAIGDIHYKTDAKEVLVHYFEKHKIPYIFMEEEPSIDYKKGDPSWLNPSWLKLICHRIFPDYDTIICWDLDLLPATPDTEVIQDFDMNSLCMAFDSTHGQSILPFCPDFKYNGGLICIPKKFSDFTEHIFDTFSRGSLPSLEQYYLNNMISENEVPVFELPRDINVLFGSTDFEKARLQHYTHGDHAKQFIALHRDYYFSKVEGYPLPLFYETRIDMVRDLVAKNSVICEIGVFKGDFTRELMKLEPSKLVLLDLFEGECGSGDQDGNNFELIKLDESYEALKKEYSDDSRVTLMKGDSSTNLGTFPADSFDMIYIDGDHGYEGCKKDLLEAYNKIKNGGWIMGHDYHMNMVKAKTSYIFGVRKAVDEFCVSKELTIHAKAIDGCVSYAIQVAKA